MYYQKLRARRPRTVEYFKYNRSFLEELNLSTTGVAELDNLLPTKVKNYLLNKNSYLELPSSMSDLADLKSELEASYLWLTKDASTIYAEYLALAKDKEHTENISETFAKGDSKVTNSYFEPVVGGTQEEHKRDAQSSTSADDVTTTTRTLTDTNTNEALIDFYDKLNELVALYFSDFCIMYY